jgi:hypothetical protein
LPLDFPKKADFANWFLRTPSISAERIICVDEAYFQLTRTSNRHNNRLWSTETPVVGIEKPLHDQKFLVFCGISVRKICAHIFFRSILIDKITLICSKIGCGLKLLRLTGNNAIIFSEMKRNPIPKI